MNIIMTVNLLCLKNVSQKTFETCCDIISDELETYLNRRKEIMNNPKVMEELNK